MSNSTLVTKWWPADKSNYTAGRNGYKIRGIVIHHAASTSLNSIGTVFSNPGRNGSAHYGVGGTEIHQYVPEIDAAWHCSNWYGNMNTVGIETTNSTGAPDWKVSDTTFDTLCRLVADIAKRNGLGKLYYNPNEDYPLLSGHKDWQGASTACPGPYLYPRLQEICDRANAINYPSYQWSDISPVSYRTKGGAKLINLKDGSTVKTYGEGELFEAVSTAVKDGVEYVRTDYSRSNGIDNGISVSELYIPEPPKPVEPEVIRKTINWSDIPVVARVTAFETSLIDLNTDKVVKELPAGEEFIAVQKATIKGEEFVRTEYSKSKNINNGVRITSLKDVVIPEPVEEPEPTKPNEEAPVVPTINPDNSNKSQENKNEGQPQTGGGEAIINAIIKTINAIVDFLKSIFKKG